MACPEHGLCGYKPTDKKCNLCNKKLKKIRTLFLQGALAEWHKKDTGKHKKSPHIDWKIATGIIDQEILDEIIGMVLFGKHSITLKIEFLEDEKQ